MGCVSARFDYRNARSREGEDKFSNVLAHHHAAESNGRIRYHKGLNWKRLVRSRLENFSQTAVKPCCTFRISLRRKQSQINTCEGRPPQEWEHADGVVGR